jgi:hypothetical protein
MWRGTKRWAAALIVGAALAQPIQAMPGATRNEPAPEGLGRVWAVAATWLSAGWQVALDELATDHGPMVDPDGAAADSDHGPMVDPNG